MLKLKRNLALILVPLLAIAAWGAFRGGTPPARAAGAASAADTITVTGTGTVEVAPDQAQVTLGAEEQSATAAGAQAALAKDTAAIENAILAAGIEKKDVTTSGYDLSPSYDKQGKITGYQAAAYFTVTVRKLDSLGGFLDAMVAAGSNRIDSIRFQRSDIAVYKEQALQKAVADAQAKAKAVAEELGQSLGPVTKVTETGPILPVYEHAASFGAQAYAPTTGGTAVEPGQLTVTASVTLENAY